MKNIAVFVSGSGSNLQALIDSENPCGRIVLVLSSSAEAYALERARAAGIATAVVGKKTHSSSEKQEKAILSLLSEYHVDLVVLAGYLSILGGELVAKYRNRIINVHPSLIPSFCGMGYYGLRVHRAALDYGVKVTGATVHFVDEGADTGAIILQRAVEVLPSDTPETLQQRVLRFEHQLLPQAVRLFCEDRLEANGRQVRITEGVSK